MGNAVFMAKSILIAFSILISLCLIYSLWEESQKEKDMSHDAIFKAFKDIFPNIETWSYKKIDSYSIEITTPERYLIFTFYGVNSWKLETK